MPEIDDARPILAIDCGTSVMSLALRARGQVLVYRDDVGNRQSACLLPALRQLLQQAQVTAPELAAVVYNRGPGMFTGLRIGIGVAQGLAAPFSIPLVGVPSLDAAASLVPDCPCVLAAIDARMNEVFYAWFDTRHHHRLSTYRVDKAEHIRPPDDAVWDEARGIGNAFTSPICGISGDPAMPSAENFLMLADSGRYPPTTPAAASLLYVRDKIALTAAEQALAKAAQ